MKIIIPLAGFGTRLRPHTYTRPKPLINVAGKAVLGHILDKLVGLDVDEIIFVVGWLGDQIREYVEANYDFPTRYVEQTELKGQAHAINLVRDYVGGPTLIIFVDTLFEADLTELERTSADGILYVKEVDDPRRFGVAVVEGGYITRLIEKPEGFEHRLAVIGLYYVKDAAFLMDCISELIEKDIQTKGEYYLADALQLMIDRGARMEARTLTVWEDCGKPETVLHTNRYLLDNGRAHVAETENSIVIPPVYIADDAVVRNSIIGPYVTIAEGSTVSDSIVNDSIIDEEAVIEDAMLTGSLIGRHARVRGTFNSLNVGDSSQVSLGKNHE